MVFRQALTDAPATERYGQTTSVGVDTRVQREHLRSRLVDHDRSEGCVELWTKGPGQDAVAAQGGDKCCLKHACPGFWGLLCCACAAGAFGLGGIHSNLTTRILVGQVRARRQRAQSGIAGINQDHQCRTDETLW